MAQSIGPTQFEYILCDLCNGVAHDPEPPHEPCDNCAGRGFMPHFSYESIEMTNNNQQQLCQGFA